MRAPIAPQDETSIMRKQRTADPRFAFTPSLEPEGRHPLLSLEGVGTLPVAATEMDALMQADKPLSGHPTTSSWFRIVTGADGTEYAQPVRNDVLAANLFLERFADEGRLCATVRTALGDIEHSVDGEGRRRPVPKLEIFRHLHCVRRNTLAERLARHPDAAVRRLAVIARPGEETIRMLLADPDEEVRMEVLRLRRIPCGMILDDVLDALRHAPEAKLALIDDVFSKRHWIEAVPILAADPDEHVAEAYEKRAQALIGYARRAAEIAGTEHLLDDNFDGEDFLWLPSVLKGEVPMNVIEAFDLLKSDG